MHKPSRVVPWIAAAALAAAAPASGEGVKGAGLADALKPSASAADRAVWSQLAGFARTGDRAVAAPSPAITADADFATAAYTVPAGGGGFYAVSDSFLRRDASVPGQVALRVSVRHAAATAEHQPAPAVLTSLSAGEVFDFDTFLGYLAPGDSVHVALGTAGEPAGDRTEIDFRVTSTPFIPVTVFPEDARNESAVVAPGGWSLAQGISSASAAKRWLAWGRKPESGFSLDADVARVALPPPSQTGGRESLIAFRVPQSGYYAAHAAWFAAVAGEADARWYVGQEATPRRTFSARGTTRVGLESDLGYVRKGEVIYLALSARGDAGATVELAGSIVEWAPRRAPLRVRRGADGTLAVFEPEAPRRAITIPAARWIEVPATPGDATEALRRALADATAAQRGDEYVGIRLAARHTYTVASQQVGGVLFPLKGARRIVFDGNGATLFVNSPELPRREVDLFNLVDCQNLVFADLIVDAPTVPFAVGEIIDVTPRDASQQTVTFRRDPGSADPIADIRRNGETDGYAYDPKIPGRMADGTWTHFPGDGPAPLKATDTPGVFTHRVRRTGASIQPGMKWLVKNKRAGVVYLETNGETENITFWRIVGRASGGTHMRFWHTSGLNLLDCRFEPEGTHWIGSSADSVHGRGREGIWIEDTLIRGVCEDVMNTYGENLVVLADENPADRVYSIRSFRRNVESRNNQPTRMPTKSSVIVGDQLVFFNPKTGRVLGHAHVQAIDDGRFTLDTSIANLDTWEEGDGFGATMVYNTRLAGRFFVRDSQVMDSLRFGIYIKARGAVIFGTRFEGLSAQAVFAANEPEWPEGPPATHLWVQDCFFSRNNDGYMSKHRAFMTVDPADISVYTRRLRDPATANDDGYRTAGAFRAHITRQQYANSHVKLIGNTFHDWRGMGIAVRNARNVRIEDNLFLAPVADARMRKSLASDPALSAGGEGRYAAIYLDSVGGVQLGGNRFAGLPAGDRNLVRDQDVTGVVERGHELVVSPLPAFDLALAFDEWFGPTSANAAPGGDAAAVELKGATRQAGRIGAGLFFDGTDDIAVLKPSAAQSREAQSALTIALWALPAEHRSADAAEVLYAQGAEASGVVIAIEHGRLVAGVWSGAQSVWLDLGAARTGVWRHIALAFDGRAGVVRGFVDGLELAGTSTGVPAALQSAWGTGSFGAAQQATRVARQGTIPAGTAFYRGQLDEFRLARRALTPEEIALLALRRP